MNQMLTPEHLTGLRRTAEKGTKGNWCFENVKHGNGLELVTDATTRHSIMWTHLHFGEPRIVFNRCEDMDYIASVCPAMLLQLLDVLDTQQARITELEVLSDELLNTLNFERGQRVNLKKDAERYRWLREQHWSDSTLAVICNPTCNVLIGTYCPSKDLLDEAIDGLMENQNANN